MTQEKWKDVPGYEGIYQVSSLGRVKSLSRTAWNGKGQHILPERIKKTIINKDGYHYLALNKNGNRKFYKVHQLVAMAFLNHEPCGLQLVVDHINEDKLDNRVENLQVITNRTNIAKSKKGTSLFTGVSKKRNRYLSFIYLNGKNNYLGSFRCETAAHLQYLKTLKSL